MLTEWFLTLIQTLIQWAIALRPVWIVHLPNSVVRMVSYSLSFDLILPIHEMFICVNALCVLATGMNVFKWTIKVIDYIADVIP